MADPDDREDGAASSAEEGAASSPNAAAAPASSDRATIYAPATAAGRSAVAVVRISGPRAGFALLSLAGGPKLSHPTPRRATFRRLHDPETDAVIDEAIVLWMPGPRTETGEDMAELQFHGGRAVMAAVLAALAKLDGLRLAQPGEFARRSFDAGKLDLTALEGLGDLVNAETEAQRRQAVRQLSGALGELYEDWRERLLRTLAHLEAVIDFPDEGLPDDVAAKIAHEVAALASEMRAHLDDGARGERLREGLRVVLTGAPNVGKSSLFNLLVRREAAIVSPEAGTTRDVIESAFDLGGYPVLLMDTAGLRDVDGNDSGAGAPVGAIEQEGIRRARARLAEADLRIRLLDATDHDLAASLELKQADDPDTILVLNKIDLAPDAIDRLPGHVPAIPLSAATGAGFAALEARLADEVARRLELGPDPALTRAHHREALLECLDGFSRMAGAPGPELASEDLRLAVRALGRITGRVDVEELLDIIFRDFCIGK